MDTQPRIYPNPEDDDQPFGLPLENVCLDLDLSKTLTAEELAKIYRETHDAWDTGYTPTPVHES